MSEATRVRTRPPPLPEWSVRTVREAGEFAAAAHQWDRLYSRCPDAMPFQSHAWLESWWRSYGQRRQLRVVMVHRAGRLVAAAPLMRTRRWGMPALVPIGAGLSDFTDVLIDESCADGAARMLASGLAQASAGAVVDLPEVPPWAAAWRLHDAWPATCRVLPASTCLEFAARPVPDLVAQLPGRKAKQLRRGLRVIGTAGVSFRLVPATDAEQAVTRLVELHRAQWRGRGINPEHARGRFADHLRRAVPKLVEADQALLVEYVCRQEVLAVDLLLVGHRLVGGYLDGCDSRLRSAVDISVMMFWGSMQQTVRLERPVYSTLRGDEAHKRKLPATEVRNRRVLLGDLPGRRARVYAHGIEGRRRLVARLKQYPAAHALRRLGRRAGGAVVGRSR